MMMMMMMSRAPSSAPAITLLRSALAVSSSSTTTSTYPAAALPSLPPPSPPTASCMGVLACPPPAAASAWGTRSFSAASAPLAPGPYPRGIVEVREYTLTPQGMADWIKLTEECAAVRKELLPMMGMFTADVAPCLHKVTHYYHYKDFDERDAVRAHAASTPAWMKYVKSTRPYVQYQENKILVEAGPVYEALGLPPTREYRSPPQGGGGPSPIYEQRSYQLHPGYGSVPKLVEAFRKGLPDKVASDPEGQLVLFGHTDVGMLNNVVELWRYPSAQACIRARQAARQVPSWREAISSVTPGVQHFTSAFLKPMHLSSWQ